MSFQILNKLGEPISIGELDKEVLSKVIATTDKTLLYSVGDDIRGDKYNAKFQLPQISESFAKQYVEVQGNIKEVLVSYNVQINSIFEVINPKDIIRTWLKTNSDYYINISLI